MNILTIQLIVCYRVNSENSENVILLEKCKIKRSTTKRKKPGIKLTVLSVSEVEGQSVTVECQLDTSKQKTVTFKFDREDMVPTDIANNLVSKFMKLLIRSFVVFERKFLKFDKGIIEKTKSHFW